MGVPPSKAVRNIGYQISAIGYDRAIGYGQAHRCVIRSHHFGVGFGLGDAFG
jgi:hypothetical protein